MPFARGEVVAVPYPFTDLTGSKTRPALVVSSDDFNRTTPDLLVAAISTQLIRANVFDHILQDWAAAGLRYPSLVKGRVVALSQHLVMRTVGRVSPADQAAYDERLLSFLFTENSVREIFLQKKLWNGLPGSRLQLLAESIVEVVVNVSSSDTNCDIERIRNLLPAARLEP